MLGTHLRRNAVAYLALGAALTTGSAYAAQELPKKLPKHSVGAKQLKSNAVSSVKVKDGALTGADLADGSVTKADLATGVVPGVTWVAGSGTTNPHASPDTVGITAYSFTLPRAGTLLAYTDVPLAAGTCSSGSMVVGLYVDGQPMPGSGEGVVAGPAFRALVGVQTLSAGGHTLSMGADCGAGNITSYNLASTGYRLVLGE